MALSRIWSAFIIIAISVAAIKFIGGFGEKQIFSSMIIGKSGDTVQVHQQSLISARPDLIKAFDTMNRVKEGKLIYKKAGESIITLKTQTANGVIETCKDAVNICIGLIGIMALFMGFMSIAERAGGINLLSRVIGPFFSKLFPDVPKGHSATGQ